MPIDLYCERTDAAFWSEPVNAVSNAAFLVAAVMAFLLWRRRADRDWPALALIGATVLVGLGSFAFHTLATRRAMLLDVVPIAAFIYGYLALALRRFLRLPLVQAGAVLAGFAAGSWALGCLLPPGFLKGSGSYLPALAAMVVVGGILRGTATGQAILAAAAVFAVSLVFRTIDQAVCPTAPVGTHAGWHLLNAAVLYLLLRAAIRHGHR